MNFVYKFLLLTVCAIELCVSAADVNSTSTTNDTSTTNATSTSRREVLELQARGAYQNACFRLQELSNWMTVVFKIKSVWASSTVNQIASRSDGILTESDRWIVPNLPSRPKTISSECSLRSAQVTVQTFAYLQSQLLLLKIILGRNILRTSKIAFGDARESLKMLDAFNSTLNDIFDKLRQNTQEVSTRGSSESRKAWEVMKDIQEGRFLQYLPNPTALFRSAKEENASNPEQRSTGFFQNLGKQLDKLFSTSPFKLNSTVVVSDRDSTVVQSAQDENSTSNPVT